MSHPHGPGSMLATSNLLPKKILPKKRFLTTICRYDTFSAWQERCFATIRDGFGISQMRSRVFPCYFPAISLLFWDEIAVLRGLLRGRPCYFPCFNRDRGEKMGHAGFGCARLQDPGCLRATLGQNELNQSQRDKGVL